MTKLIPTLVAALVAAVAVNAQAASHMGGAPMKASEAEGKASAPMKKHAKHEKKAMKKEEKKEDKK